MIMSNVYRCRMAIKHLYSNIFSAFKLVGQNDNERQIKNVLYSQSKMSRIVRFNCNVLAHLLGALCVILLVPSNGVVLEHDGTERIKRELIGVILQWDLPNDIDFKFKRIVKDDETVSMADHFRDTKVKTAGNLVIGYKESFGKDSKSLFKLFSRLFGETDHYQAILKRPENRVILEEAFGANNLNDVFGKDLSVKCASFHTDLVEKLHGLSSQLLKIKQTLSEENLENYNLWTKNHLPDFLNYLEECYPKVYEMMTDIAMNEKITHLMETAKNNKKSLKQKKIGHILNKLMTKTDHIRVDKEKQRIENQRKIDKENKSRNANKGGRKKRTKSARHIHVEENKKRTQKEKDMNSMRNGAKKRKKKQKKNTNNKKKNKNGKQYRKKDCVEESGIDEVVKVLQFIGYCGSKESINTNNASTQPEESNDNNEDNALLQELEQLDAFSDDDD
eukprot:926755_1